MEHHDDFPLDAGYLPQEPKPGFFSSALHGVGQLVAGFFIGTCLYFLWAFTIGRQLGPHATFGWGSLALLPAFWWVGTPDVLLYFKRWFGVMFGRLHWETPPAVWYSLLNWGSLMWILILTPRIGFLILVAIGALAFVGRSRAAKGGTA